MANLIAIQRQDFLLAVSIGTIRLAARVKTIILVSVIRVWEAFPCDDARPGVVDVNVAGVVEHVRGEAAWRPHIHLQGEEIVRCGTEKLKMEKALAYVKGFEGTASKGF